MEGSSGGLGKNCLNAGKNAINHYGVITVESMRTGCKRSAKSETGRQRAEARGSVEVEGLKEGGETVTKGCTIVLESQLGLRHALYSIKPKCTARDPFFTPFRY